MEANEDEREYTVVNLCVKYPTKVGDGDISVNKYTLIDSKITKSDTIKCDLGAKHPKDSSHELDNKTGQWPRFGHGWPCQDRCSALKKSL